MPKSTVSGGEEAPCSQASLAEFATLAGNAKAGASRMPDVCKHPLSLRGYY
jgi:hypothetical protein